MTFRLGKLAQVIHVTDDLARARHVYGDVFDGECYYEGYNPYEKRDASIYAIGDLTIEPMSPSDEEGALDYPVGRFLTRFGPRLHSLAINATDVMELAEHLLANEVRVVGPGGVPLTDSPQRESRAIYTHPRDTHFLIEFVDFGSPLMPASPRLADDWDPSRWASHPLGVLGPSHVTALVHDVDAATAFFTGILATPVVREPTEATGARTARIRLGTETIVELHQPLDETSSAGMSLAAHGEGLFEVAIRVADLDATAEHLAAHSIATTPRDGTALVLDTASTAGANLVVTTDEPV